MIKINEKGCWEWLGWKNDKGYGLIEIGHRRMKVHRLMYMLIKGDVPAYRDIHHECNNPGCCNPDHLCLVSAFEHSELSEGSVGWMNRMKTHCKRGHEFNEENTLWVMGENGRRSRNCKRCNRDRAKEYFAKRKRVRIKTYGRSDLNGTGVEVEL